LWKRSLAQKVLAWQQRGSMINLSQRLLLYGALKECNRDSPSYFDDVQKKVSRDLHNRYRPNEFHLAPLIATTFLHTSIEEWGIYNENRLKFLKIEKTGTLNKVNDKVVISYFFLRCIL
jgi:hypothetical protein